MLDSPIRNRRSGQWQIPIGLSAAGDNPGCSTSEASYAVGCGVSPVEASSGKIHRLRLNRGGDRWANAALSG
ncbi:transposase [Catellatospora citrea]|uniref:transposase n=1 Tax=Catellatospora citrea TaxID=53366 RepID=UPI00357117F3